jgi:hypothetical protein
MKEKSERDSDLAKSVKEDREAQGHHKVALMGTAEVRIPIGKTLPNPPPDKKIHPRRPLPTVPEREIRKDKSKPGG